MGRQMLRLAANRMRAEQLPVRVIWTIIGGGRVTGSGRARGRLAAAIVPRRYRIAIAPAGEVLPPAGVSWIYLRFVSPFDSAAQ
jgi:hypothetical protein